MRLTHRAALAPLAIIPGMPFPRSPAFARALLLELTLECYRDVAPTPALTVRRYPRPGAPMKRDLAPDVAQGARTLIGCSVVA